MLINTYYKLAELLATKNNIIIVLFLVIFHNGSLLHHNYGTVNSAFVYYQNYEYLSTIKLNDYADYYGNVKLLRYSIPTDVLSAIWRLQIIATDNCPPTSLYLYN